MTGNRGPELESTAALIARTRAGDREARERLMCRYLPQLTSWAHGRLPPPARHLADTDDLVQITLFKTLERLQDFEPEREEAFFAYLRRALVNQIRDHLRAARRRPGRELLVEPISTDASPLDDAVTHERLAAYEKVLKRLGRRHREAVILRVELGCDYREVAEVIGAPSANAARMVVSRALARMAELMPAD